MRLSFAIQHHPRRAALLPPLLDAIGGHVEVVTDPDPDARLNGKPFPSPWRTYAHALERTPIRATHRVILQDDAIVCRDFALTVENAIAARPDRLLALFVSGRLREHVTAVGRACAQDLPWCELPYMHWCPTVALVWPIRLVPACLEFVEAQRWPPEFRADDEIVGQFCRSLREHPLATVPSLVEHPDVEESLIGKQTSGGTSPGRMAACFIHPDCEPLAVDWSHGPG